MEGMHLQRLDRAFSSGEPSCCPTSRLPLRRLKSMPCKDNQRLSLDRQSSRGCGSTQAMSRASSVISTSSTLHREDTDTIIDPEAELLSEGESPDSLSREFRAQVANLQNLERVKGKLHQAMLDLPDPDTIDGDWRAEDGFSEEDWTMLRAATLQHQAEQSRLQFEEAKKLQERKKERALKRAARKAQAEMTGDTQAQASPFASTTALTRRSNNLLATTSGARATARSRSRANAKWGRSQAEAEVSTNGKAPVWRGSLSAMGSIGSHTLLSGKEEVELSQKVQDFLKLEQAYNELGEKLGRKPDLEEWSHEFGQDGRTFMARLEEGATARTKMLTCNQRLVVSIARKYQNKGMEMNDLIQEGMVGLLRGVEKFDHTKGFKFSTYATWWIRQAITRSISELSRMIRLPAHLNEMLSKLSKEEAIFLRTHKRVPTDDELAKLIGVNANRIRQVKNAAKSPTSLDDTLASGTQDKMATTVGELIEDTTVDDMDMQMLTNSMHRDVNAVLSTLSPREHGIIRMRYGLDDGQPKTLEEIGVAFHVTRERIRQIENKALANLKNPSRNSTLNTYVDGEALSLLQEPGWKDGIQRDSSH